jgi:hypothetical protein
MSHFSKKLVVFAVIGLSLAAASSSYAEETQSDKSFTGFFRRLFNYPGKAVQSTADTTGHALSNTGEKVLAKTGENIAEGRPVEALTQPVVGAVETTGQAGAEVARVPVTAAEESAKAADQQ